MKKNVLTTFAALSLLSHASLYSWSMGNRSQEIESKVPQNFPFSQQQEWFTEESYLLMKPYAGNMMYGNKNTFEQTEDFTYNNKIKVQEPEFEWSSGVRVAVGRYLPNHDLWDIGFTTTFYYSDTSDKTKANAANNVGFNPSFFASLTTLQDSGKFDWKLNYWTLDLMVGRLFDMTETTVFHPYFGLRGSLQYQHAHASAFLFKDSGDGIQSNLNTRSGVDNDFWGVGPRVGTAFIYYFENHFSFLANISASLLVGAQHLKQKVKENLTTIRDGDVSYRFQTLKTHDSLEVIRSNVEASVGLGWERWLKNNTVRVAPSLNFEGALWFAMNQLSNFYPSGSSNTNVQKRRHGNLGLMGVSFNLQVDF